MDGTDKPLQPNEDVFLPTPTNDGVIPVLNARGRSVAQAWENSMVELWKRGREIRTEYDRKDKDGNFIDPPSRDCTMMVVVEDPAAEPRFHRCFPGGPAELQEYRMEVLDGIHDHWMDEPDPTGTKWSYTYHDRLTKYQGGCEWEDTGGTMQSRLVMLPPIDQIRKMIEHLARSPYTRRCQAVTWQAWDDMDANDPPCLQSIWCRILFDADGEWWLNMNVRFRSRDSYLAAFMNMDALVHLMQYIADEVGKIAGRKVRLGHYCDLSDSYHIYGKDQAKFEREFLNNLHTRPFEERTYTSDVFLPLMKEAIPAILEKARSKGAS